MNTLTAKQQQIVDYVVAYNRKHHCSPSFREVGLHFGIQGQAVVNHLKAIVKKGALVIIRTAEGKHRGWRLPTKKERTGG